MKRKTPRSPSLKDKHKASLEIINAMKIEMGNLQERCAEQERQIVVLANDKRRIDKAIQAARPQFGKYEIEVRETLDREKLIFTRHGVSITLTYALVLQLGCHPIIKMFAGDSRDVRMFLDGIAAREVRLPTSQLLT